MSAFALDSFTDTAGTALASHTGETGATWAKQASNTGSAIVMTGNRVRCSDQNVVKYFASGAPGSADYASEATITFPYIPDPTAGQDDIAGVGVRMNTAADTGYFFFWFRGNWQLFKYVAGTGTALGSAVASGAIAANSSFNLRLRVIGTTLTGYLNGVAICTATDSSIAANGQAGIFMFSHQAAPSDTQGPQIDNFQALVPTNFAVANASLFFSPYNWYLSAATFRTSVTPGAYLRTSFTGTDAVVNYDASALPGVGNNPWIRCVVDGGAAVDTELGATGSTILAHGLAQGSHTLLLTFLKSSESQDRWTTPANAVKVTGVQIDGTLSTPTTNSKNAIFFGDSITEGIRVIGFTSNYVADNDATLVYAGIVAANLKAEFGQIGYGSLGWDRPGTAGSNVPKFYTSGDNTNTSWDKYFNTTFRTSSGSLAPTPDYVFVVLGTNDALQGTTDATVESKVSAWLTAIRAATSPSTLVYLVIPFGLYKESAVIAGFNDYQATPDPNAKLIDLGAAGQAFTTGIYSADNVHPNAAGHAGIASLINGRLSSSFPPRLNRLAARTSASPLRGRSL